MPNHALGCPFGFHLALIGIWDANSLASGHMAAWHCLVTLAQDEGSNSLGQQPRPTASANSLGQESACNLLQSTPKTRRLAQSHSCHCWRSHAWHFSYLPKPGRSFDLASSMWSSIWMLQRWSLFFPRRWGKEASVGQSLALNSRRASSSKWRTCFDSCTRYSFGRSSAGIILLVGVVATNYDALSS